MIRISERHHLNIPFYLGLILTFAFSFHYHLSQTKERKGARRSGLRVLPRLHVAAHRRTVYLSSPPISTIATLLSSYITRWVSGYFRGDGGEATMASGERSSSSKGGCRVEGCRQRRPPIPIAR